MHAPRTWILLLSLAAPAAALQSAPTTQEPAAQQPAAPAAQGPAAARQGTQPEGQAPATAQGAAFPAEQLEQIVAPIALYPDSLLAQILMASTYPLEVVEAARWVQKNPGLKEKQLESALQGQTWDPSVKGLCAFPDVLKRMSDNLDWTQDLGDAFLGQKEAVMAAVQTMRRKAYDTGKLTSTKELTVTEQSETIIIIEQADPEVVYVPTYYPTAVYGSWSYPYWYYPPLYPPPPAGGFFWGFTVGVIWGGCWGNCNWGHTDIDIDIDRQNNFIDRTERPDHRQQVKDRAKTSDRKFQHNPEHRKGVGYKDSKVAQRYGGGAGQTRVSRDQARGYGDRSAQRPAAGGTRPGGGTIPAQRPSAGTSRPGGGTTPAQRPAAGSGAGTRPTTQPARTTGTRSGSYSGARSSSMDRAGSSRGSVSRGSAGSRGAARGGGGRGGRR